MQNLSGIGNISELKINGNRSLRYLKTGNGDPLILIHTIRTQLDYFEEVISELAKHFTVYAIDLPGHGYSSIDPKASYNEPYFRSAVIEFIEILDLKEVTLVGESIGGVLALTVASQLTSRIKKVVSSNPYDYDRKYGDGVRRGNFLANFVISQFAIPYVGAVVAAMENILFLGIIMSGGLKNKRCMPSKLLKEFDRVGRRKGYRHVERSTFAGWQSWGQAKSLYSGVKAPVKLIYGQHDWSTVAEREHTATHLGGVSISTVANTGHFAFVDNPQKITEILLAN
jgi:pimeloyl-ACP methyl ester carboxylesterase